MWTNLRAYHINSTLLSINSYHYFHKCKKNKHSATWWRSSSKNNGLLLEVNTQKIRKITRFYGSWKFPIMKLNFGCFLYCIPCVCQLLHGKYQIWSMALCRSGYFWKDICQMCPITNREDVIGCKKQSGQWTNILYEAFCVRRRASDYSIISVSYTHLTLPTKA